MDQTIFDNSTPHLNVPQEWIYGNKENYLKCLKKLQITCLENCGNLYTNEASYTMRRP